MTKDKTKLDLILNVIGYGGFIFLVIFTGYNLYVDWDYKPTPMVQCEGYVEEYNNSFQCGRYVTQNTNVTFIIDLNLENG